MIPTLGCSGVCREGISADGEVWDLFWGQEAQDISGSACEVPGEP